MHNTVGDRKGIDLCCQSPLAARYDNRHNAGHGPVTVKLFWELW
jgi:hypothetical protein